MKIHHSAVILRPVDEVFGYVTSLENETAWQPEIESVQLDGPIAAGVTFTEVRRSLGWRFKWLFEITVYEKNREIRIRTLAGTVPYEGSRLFESVEGGTRVTEVGEVETPTLLKALDPLFMRFSRRALAAAYGNLKRILEAAPRRLSVTSERLR